MKIYPVPGRLVRDPRTRTPVPAEGREVPDHDPFWQRRVRDGDVTIEAPATKPEPGMSATEAAPDAAHTGS